MIFRTRVIIWIKKIIVLSARFFTKNSPVLNTEISLI